MTIQDIPKGLLADILVKIHNIEPKKAGETPATEYDDYYGGQVDMRSDIYWTLKEYFEMP